MMHNKLVKTYGGYLVLKYDSIITEGLLKNGNFAFFYDPKIGFTNFLFNSRRYAIMIFKKNFPKEKLKIR